MTIETFERPPLRRQRRGVERTTPVELFFDLVYVFAVTQLSHHLVQRPSLAGALQTLVLLAMVWTVWVYTAWITNWLNPAHVAVRTMLVVLMLGSLLLSAAIPGAFAAHGLIFGAVYAAV